MIYFTSDLHLMHDKEFVYKPRGYTNVFEMSMDLIININNIVKEDDVLYILGDLMLNDCEAAIGLLKNIKCKNIHIILGNHDTKAKQVKYLELPNVCEVSYADILEYGKYNFFLSHYPTITTHIDFDKSPNKQQFNLCGHSHTIDKFTEMQKGINSYHVELDAHHNEPISIDDIIKDIKEFYNDKAARQLVEIRRRNEVVY